MAADVEVFACGAEPAAGALEALIASFALCFSLRLSSLEMISMIDIDKLQKKRNANCLEIISFVTGSLWVPAGSEDIVL